MKVSATSCVSRSAAFIRGMVIAFLLSVSLTELAAQQVVRGPYLQRGAPSSMVVRWRTDKPTPTRLEYGASPEALTSVSESLVLTTEHEVELAGLTPQTRYFYRIAAGPQVLVGGDAEHYFVTSGNTHDEPVRAWILGDSGSSGRLKRGEDPSQAGVRDAFLKRYPPSSFNFLIVLGDNAYDKGTDVEYQRGFFDVYRSVLRSKVAWSTQGNHDYSANAHYDVLTLPTKGESGGVASGTEHYYSFDQNNVHFISLNSERRDEELRASMIRWLREDLAANTRDWTVAFWHHPPYSKGHHDSDDTDDSGGRMEWMRVNVLPILEEAGVDVVFAGHSHSYERSKFMTRQYGPSTEFNERNVVQPGDGHDDAGRAYTKERLGKIPHSGTVYVTAGSSGMIYDGSLNHPAMVVSLLKLGSVLLSVDGNEMRSTMIGADGQVEDHFTIRKDPARPLAVQNLTLRVHDTGCEVELSWKAGATDSSYVVYRSLSVDSRGREIGRVTSGVTTFIDKESLPEGSQRWYSVRALNAKGQGPWGDPTAVPSTRCQGRDGISSPKR